MERGWWTQQGVDTLLADPNRHAFRVYSLVMLELAVRLFVEQPLSNTSPSTTLEEFS
jgi:asparagine synthase (glutamine-hydrolysing)